VNYFITPDLKDMSGGNKYDLNILNYLNDNNYKLTNIFIIKYNDSLINIFIKINKLPRNSTLLIDGLIAAKMHLVINTLIKKYKIILLIHHPVSYENNKYGDTKLKLKEKVIFSKAHSIITVSYSMKKVIKKMLNYKKEIYVIKPGVDDIYHHNHVNVERTYNIVTTGSVIRRKNIEKCIDVLSYLDNKWTLSIIGDYDITDNYYKKLKLLINKHNLDNRVTFHGMIENETDLIMILKKSMIYICLSKYEGYGMANIEAATIGLPLVVTDLPVFRENLKGYNRKYINLKKINTIIDAVKDMAETKVHKNITAHKWKDVGYKFKRVLNES
tara:strand:- start:4026 stop:5012 length:987 start_codon:yes stop_codon:yes gene_type:complete